MTSRWVVYTFASVISWGVWGLMLKLAVNNMKGTQAAFWANAAEIIILYGVMSSCGHSLFAGINGKGFGWAIGAGLVGGAGLLLNNLALKEGPLSVVSPMTAMYPVITLILAVVLLHETISLKQIMGIVIAVGGFALVL